MELSLASGRRKSAGEAVRYRFTNSHEPATTEHTFPRAPLVRPRATCWQPVLKNENEDGVSNREILDIIGRFSRNSHDFVEIFEGIYGNLWRNLWRPLPQHVDWSIISEPN